MLTNSFTTSTAKIEKNEDIYVLHTCYSTTLAWYEECIICLIDTFEKKENQKTIRSNWRHSTCTLNALGLDCGYNWLFSDSRDIAWPLPLRSTVRQKSLRLPRQPAFRPNRQVQMQNQKKGKGHFLKSIHFRFGADFTNAFGAVIPRITSNAAFHNIFWSITIDDSAGTHHLFEEIRYLK